MIFKKARIEWPFNKTGFYHYKTNPRNLHPKIITASILGTQAETPCQPYPDTPLHT